VIFGSYILTALVASLPVNTFASLNSIVEKLFNITIVEISLNTLMFPIAHTIFAFPCNWILNKKGIRISYYIAAIFAITGVWLRTLLAPGQPYICLLGSLLSAIGGIFILNTPSRLAITWFKFETVPFITFTGVLINLVSMALGLTIPGALITPDSSKENISSFLRLEAIIVTVPFIILAILIREKPELPPSKAALVINTVKPGHYIKILKSLFTNLEYIKLSLSMALTFGVCIGFLAVLERVLVGIGYTHASRTISICGTSGIIVGIFANIGYSIYLKKTKHYKRVLMIGKSFSIKQRQEIS
jgi:MFS family permease